MSCVLQRIDGPDQKVFIRPDRSTGYYRAGWRIKFREFECQAIKVEDGLYMEIPGSTESKPFILSKKRKAICQVN
jgi:hypothetical protein